MLCLRTQYRCNEMIINKLYLAIGLAAIIALSSFGLWLHGVISDRDKFEASAKFEKAQKDIAIKTLDEQAAEQAHTNSILEVYHESEAKIQYVDRVVTKQVIEYRDRNHVRIQLPDDFVRAYNDSTSELYSESPSIGANDSTGTLAKIVNDADALEVATSNNRACVRNALRLRALQSWAAPQK